jgi:hypothetical protein
MNTQWHTIKVWLYLKTLTDNTRDLKTSMVEYPEKRGVISKSLTSRDNFKIFLL